MNANAPLRALCLAVALLLPALPGRADENVDGAVKAAESWLALVDARDYKKSWEEAAPFFKERVSEFDWIKMAALARDPFGKLKSRELKTAKYTKTLPGAPDGEYVVIQFRTSLAHKENAIETVTPMKDEHGAWKVSGYFIK